MKIIQLNNYDQIVKFINNADYHIASYLYKLPQAHENVEATIKQAIDDPGVFAQINEEMKSSCLSSHLNMKIISIKLLDLSLIKIKINY